MPAGEPNSCSDFPCTDVRHAGNVQPEIPQHPETVRVMMVSTAPPADLVEASTPGNRLVLPETLAAFRSAGYHVNTVDDVIALGVYVTTATKCPKLGFGLKPQTIAQCSYILESEIDLFPELRSILLMGNSAIRAINEIAIRREGHPIIPTGSAYKVKGYEYHLGDITLFPSYPESGRNLSVESDKSEVVAVDIRNAIEVSRGPVNGSHQIRPRQGRHRSPGSPLYGALGGSGE